MQTKHSTQFVHVLTRSDETESFVREELRSDGRLERREKAKDRTGRIESCVGKNTMPSVEEAGEEERSAATQSG